MRRTVRIPPPRPGVVWSSHSGGRNSTDHGTALGHRGQREAGRKEEIKEGGSNWESVGCGVQATLLGCKVDRFTKEVITV